MKSFTKPIARVCNKYSTYPKPVLTSKNLPFQALTLVVIPESKYHPDHAQETQVQLKYVSS